MCGCRNAPSRIAATAPCSDYIGFSADDSPPVGATIVQVDSRFLWWMLPLALAVSGAGLAWAWKSVDDRRLRIAVLRGFGVRFVHEFPAALPQRHSAADSIAAAICASIGRDSDRAGRRADVSKPGRSHQERGIRRRASAASSQRRRIHRGPLYAEGPWVVIPCRVVIDKQQEGVS